MLVSRFLLDLQSANRDALKLGTRDPLNTELSQAYSRSSGTLTFARIVGSVGLLMDLPESLTGITQYPEDDDSTAYVLEDLEQRHEDIALTEDLGVFTSSRGLVETSVSSSTSRIGRALQYSFISIDVSM